MPDAFPISATPDSIAAARQGRPEAIALLYRAHAGALLRLAHRLTGNAHDAEDVVQDVFVGLPEALRHYQEQGKFAEWLRRVTARTALMSRRRSELRQPLPLPDGVAAIDETDALAAGEIARRAIDALPQELRDVFVLKELEGYSHAEIAAMLGIRRGTSEVRLFRAIRKLRATLGTRS